MSPRPTTSSKRGGPLEPTTSLGHRLLQKPAHTARGPDGTLVDLWPQAEAVSSTRRRLIHPSLPLIHHVERRGDAVVVVRERVFGPTLHRLAKTAHAQAPGSFELGWALHVVGCMASVLALPKREQLPAVVLPETTIVDISGRVFFVGFEHWAWQMSEALPFADDVAHLAGLLFWLLTGQRPTPTREQLSRLELVLGPLPQGAAGAGLLALLAKNLQASRALRHSRAQFGEELRALQGLLPAVGQSDLAALVWGLFPDDCQQEQDLRDEP